MLVSTTKKTARFPNFEMIFKPKNGKTTLHSLFHLLLNCKIRCLLHQILNQISEVSPELPLKLWSLTHSASPQHTLTHHQASGAHLTNTDKLLILTAVGLLLPQLPDLCCSLDFSGCQSSPQTSVGNFIPSSPPPPPP